MLHVDMSEIDQAATEDAWDWLQDNAPRWAAAVQTVVERKASADQVYRRVLGNVGLGREALAVRCKLAAQYLIAQNGHKA